MGRFWRIIVFSIVFIPSVILAAEYPSPVGFVNDFAGVLDSGTRTFLEAEIAGLKERSGAEISLVTVSTLAGDTIENYAVELFREWGIGERGKDNGLLFVVAPNEREVRIEVGYGLEGAVPDAEANRVIQKIVTPAFKEGNYPKGISEGVLALIKIVSGEALVYENESPRQISALFARNAEGIIFFFVFALSWFASIFARSKSWWAGGVVGFFVGLGVAVFQTLFIGGAVIVGSTLLGLLFDYLVSKKYGESLSGGRTPPWWAGGSGGFGGGSGGGFGGFGGGMSGGGGASGRW